MDIDFHYYATYAAAALAGWSKDDSETIAYAAQFVDEFDYSYGYEKKPWVFGADAELPEPVRGKLRYTSTSDGRCKLVPRKTVQNDKSDFALTMNTRTDIWMTYHFLPGNFTPIGVENHPQYIQRKGASPLLCRPFSASAIAMIKDLFDYKDTLDQHPHDYTNYFLHLLGLRMHVFCDTWAHQDFVGDNKKEINDCAGWYNFFEITPGVMEQVDWKILSTNTEYAPVVVSYLGHGRLGHFPDFSWCRYYYTPAWMQNGKTHMLERDNPAEYETAFFEMIKIMYKIRTGTEPVIATILQNYGAHGESGEQRIRRLFRNTVNITDKSTALTSKANVFNITTGQWNVFILNIGKENPNIFDVRRWRGVAKNATFNYENIDVNSDIYKFNLASEHHFAHVREYLKAHKIVDVRAWDTRPQFSRNVKWVADETRQRCTNFSCSKPFTFSLRKHHCRTCGEIFCHTCAPVRDEVGERICGRCLSDQAVQRWITECRTYNEKLARQMVQMLGHM